MAYGLVPLSFPLKNNMCILISQTAGLMERDKLSPGFSSGNLHFH